MSRAVYQSGSINWYQQPPTTKTTSGSHRLLLLLPFVALHVHSHFHCESNAQLSDAWKWINCLRIDRCTVAQSITVSGHSSSLRRSPCRSEWFADKSHCVCVINVSDWTKGIITRACYEGEQDGTGQDRQMRSEWNEMAPLGSTEDNHRLAATPRLQVIVCSSHGQSCFPLRKSQRNQLMKFPCSFLAQHRQRMPFKLSGQMLL